MGLLRFLAQNAQFKVVAAMITKEGGENLGTIRPHLGPFSFSLIAKNPQRKMIRATAFLVLHKPGNRLHQPLPNLIQPQFVRDLGPLPFVGHVKHIDDLVQVRADLRGADR